VLAEWLTRQLRRVNTSTSQIVEYQEVGGGLLDGVRVDLDAHIQNEADPHNVQHTQLADVAANQTHDQIDAELTRLEDEKVAKAGDTMTGDLIVDGTTTGADVVLKGVPIDLGSPSAGAALLLNNEADVQIGGIAAVTTDPADPSNIALFVGSLDRASMVYLDGAAAIIGAENIAIGTVGAVLGSRLICTGFTSSGLPVLAWEDPPPSMYDDQCTNPTDFQIHLGTDPDAWIEVCVITTTQQIEASQSPVLYWSVRADNRSIRTGSLRVAFTVDAEVPNLADGSVEIAAGMNEIVSGSASVPGALRPVGTTIHFHVRGIGTHAQFDLWAQGTVDPSTMTIQVR
jgi:hypothetical protein